MVSFYYAFIGDRSIKRVTDDAAAREDEGNQADEDKDETDTMTTVLVCRDAKSRVCCAIPVPQKGIDVEERGSQIPGCPWIHIIAFGKRPRSITGRSVEQDEDTQR